MNNTEYQTNARDLFCLNPACCARGKRGENNSVSHGKKRPRFVCKTCGKACSIKAGTMYEGLRKPEWLITLVVNLIANGCTVQAVVRTFHLDERTVARWVERAGKHGEQVHEELIVRDASWICNMFKSMKSTSNATRRPHGWPWRSWCQVDFGWGVSSVRAVITNSLTDFYAWCVPVACRWWLF
jgi:transposase-like protein